MVVYKIIFCIDHKTGKFSIFFLRNKIVGSKLLSIIFIIKTL